MIEYRLTQILTLHTVRVLDHPFYQIFGIQKSANPLVKISQSDFALAMISTGISFLFLFMQPHVLKLLLF